MAGGSATVRQCDDCTTERNSRRLRNLGLPSEKLLRGCTRVPPSRWGHLERYPSLTLGRIFHPGRRPFQNQYTELRDRPNRSVTREFEYEASPFDTISGERFEQHLVVFLIETSSPKANLQLKKITIIQEISSNFLIMKASFFGWRPDLL